VGARASRFTTYSAGAARSLARRPSVLSPLPHSQFRVVCAEQVAEKRRASRHPEPGSFEARDRHFMFASQCRFFGACWRLRMTTQPRFSANRESRVPRVPNRAPRLYIPDPLFLVPAPKIVHFAPTFCTPVPLTPRRAVPSRPRGRGKARNTGALAPLGKRGPPGGGGPTLCLSWGRGGQELTIIRKSIYVNSIILNL